MQTYSVSGSRKVAVSGYKPNQYKTLLRKRSSFSLVPLQAHRNGNKLSIKVTAAAQVQQTKTQEKVEFMTELRQYAMKLHTREQAPKEGQNEKKSTPVQQWTPTLQGYLNFLAQSKIVYEQFEKIFRESSDPNISQFQNNGMERAQALQNDITWYKNQFKISENENISEGTEYAKFLEDLAQNSPPAFICHFYNHFFAHTAGGMMIGKKISKDILDGKTLEFYQYEGDLKSFQKNIRDKINLMAEQWSEEEKMQCLEATKGTFEWGSKLLGLITMN